MLTSHETLVGHVKTNFQLTFHHKYSQRDISEMIPWERLVLIDLIQEFLKNKEIEKRSEMNAKKDMAKALQSISPQRRK